MSDDSADVAEELAPVFLELGKTLYICQAFEGTLVLLLSVISHQEAYAEDGAFASAIDLYSQRTLGQLLKRLAETIDLPTELQTHLTLGWDRRNAIVHRFVHEHSASLLRPKGRIEVERMLVRYKQEIKSADLAANRVLDLYLKNHGLTIDGLKKNADRLWDHLNRVNTVLTAKH